MIQNESIASEFLVTSAPAYAAMAANRLLEKAPSVQQQFGDKAFRHWKEHFQQRLLELSAAIAEKEPRLFSSQVSWSLTAFQAREISPDVLRESLNCLREILTEELPESSRQPACDYLDLALNEMATGHKEEANAEQDNPQTKLAFQYLLAVLEGDGHRAINMITSAVQQGLPLEDAYEKVLLAAQREIGAMWHRAEISISEEHYVTSTTQRAMAVLCHLAQRQPLNGWTIVSAAVAGNSHDIGVRAISDFFELDGWRAVCLGGDAPDIDIAQSVEYFGAQLVLISAALSTQLPAVRQTIKHVREISANCKIMVGGGAFAATPDIWQQLGADGYASTLSGALKTGTSLVQSEYLN